jgi:cobalt-zinc-cadmium efflux system outer membrane protein
MKLRYYKTITFLLLLFLLNFFSFSSPTEKSYTLDELTKLLKQHSLLLQITEIGSSIAKEEYRAARALPNPEIELSKGEGELLVGSGNPSLWGVGAKVSIPNPIYRHYFLKSLRKNITAAGIEGDIKKKSIIRALREHYFRLQLSRKIGALLQEKINRLQEVSRITKAKASIGEVKEIDFLRSSVEIQKHKSYLFKMEKIVATSKTRINEFLNFTLNKDFSVLEDFGFTPLTDIENKIDGLIKKSPFVLLKLNELAQKKAGVKAGRHSLIESIEVHGERGKEVEAKLWKFGIGFSIPIFNTKSAEVRKAKYERQKARKELEHAQKHIFADINRIISEIRVSEKEIETFTGAVLKEGRKNIELSEKLYKAGEIPLVVFLDSQNSFFEIEQRYYEAITEWKMLKAELEELLGEKI